MRLVPRRWSTETWVCSIRGHVLPAAHVRTLRPEDVELGVDLADGRRLARCLRCDVWVGGPPPGPDAAEHLPTIDELPRPRRGKALEDVVLLRLIAVERAVHSIAFTLLAVALLLLESNLSHVQSWASSVASRLDIAVADTGQQAGRTWTSRGFADLLHLRQGELRVLLATAVVYAVVEGVEAVGLWRERRWAEYLTAAATVGFLPFELIELSKKVTTFRVGALVVNLAVLVWLVYAKRLFGLRGGAAALEEESRRESLAVLASMEPAGDAAAAG